MGKKTAERLLVELKDRLGNFANATQPAAVPGSHRGSSIVVTEAEDALISLGYKPAEAQRAVRSVRADSSVSEETTEQLLRAALKQIARQVEVTG